MVIRGDWLFETTQNSDGLLRTLVISYLCIFIYLEMLFMVLYLYHVGVAL